MIFARVLRSKCARLVLVCGVGLALAGEAAADQITLAWDPSAGSVGYKVHVGVQSGSYTQHFDVGSATSFTFTDATAGQRYCFAVSAYLLSSLLEGSNSAEVCGFSNAPPTLQNPGNRTSVVGQPTSLQLVGSDPASQPLTYSATGLPPGLSIQASTGYISGTGTQAGSFTVSATASDGTLTATQTFTWVMTAPTGSDTTRPTISIASPTSGSSFSTSASTITLSGTAADNIGVTQVHWSSDRGGSGIATGTTAWSISGIPLSTGPNVITVTAVDAAGNAGIDTLTVNRSGTTPDTTLPTITIEFPSGSQYSTSLLTITVSGKASDNVGVTQVSWSSSSGSSGTANGTTSWTASVPLVAGTNLLTFTALDASGNRATRLLTVTRTAPVDTTEPTISIRTPTRQSSYTSTRSPLTIGGVASDNVGVAQVRWSTDRGESGIASGTTSWSALVPLEGGSTTVTVTALDAAGNQAADTLRVTYNVTTPPPSTVILKADPIKTSWFRAARLTWSGATWSSVDVYRNNMRVTNTSNDGSYLDPIWRDGTYSYRICASGSTTNCSNTITVFF